MKQMYSDNHPPWEVLNLVAGYLGPRTLTIATCVNKTWRNTMSSDHIWKPICFTHYPSLALLTLTHPNISYHRLYTLAHLSSLSRTIRPSVPSITLKELFFTVDMFKGQSNLFSFTKAGEDLSVGSDHLFRFEFDVEHDNKPLVLENCDELRVRLIVVLEGWRGVFMLMDGGKKGRFIPSYGRWFSEELPSVGCCIPSTGCCVTRGESGSGVAAELGFKLGKEGSDGKKMMEVGNVSMSLLSIISWRYLSVEEGLRYLQRFLLPSVTCVHF